MHQKDIHLYAKEASAGHPRLAFSVSASYRQGSVSNTLDAAGCLPT